MKLSKDENLKETRGLGGEMKGKGGKRGWDGAGGQGARGPHCPQICTATRLL